MKAHTSQFKEDIKTIGKQLDSKIIYELDGVVQTLTSEQLNSITPTFQGAILKSVMKELDIDSNVDIPIGTKVNYQFGLKTEGDFEYVNYGNYIVYSSEKQEDYDSYKIVCYDKMLYSMKKNEDLGITYPKIIRDYMNALCNKLGLEFKNKNDEFANFDRQIGEELYAGQDYTYRDIFDQLAEVTASTICLDENDKVEIRYINDLTDLYTVNGKEVTFESDIEYPMSFQVNGSTEQTTYSGKQLIKNPTSSTDYTNGLTVKIKNTNTYILNGTTISTANWQNITNRIYEDLETGTYTISIDKPQTFQINLKGNYEDDTAFQFGINVGSTKTTFTVAKAIKSFYIFTAIFANTTINNVTFKFQLEKGDTNTEIEPYVGATPSPNLDYPQEIKNIKGVENIWFGGESTTNNGITFTKNADGSYDITGTATASADCINLVNIANAKLKNGINYNLSINKLTNEKVIILTEAYANETWDSHVINALNTSNSFLTNKIINIKDNITRVRYGIRVEKGQTVNIKGLKIQLEEGPIAHDFVPNGSNYLQLKNVKKNLFDKNNLHFILGTVDVESITINNVGKSFYIKCKPNTTYTISRKIVGSRFVVGTTNGIPKQGEKVYDRVVNNAGSSITLTTSSNSNYLCVYYLINSTENENNILDNIQIEEGSESTSYEPYKEKIINVDLKGNNLCSNKDKSVKDELLVENGKAKIYKKIKEVVLTGNESITRQTTLQSNKYRFNITCDGLPSINSGVIPDLLCSHFKPTNRTNTYNCINGIALGQNIVQVYDDTLSSMSEDEFKAKLKSMYDAGTPVKVQFQLENPEVIELDTVTPLKSYIGQNNISNNADADMNVTYSKNYETIDANFLKDINVNFGEKYGPVNSIVLSRSAESDNIYLQDEESIAKNGLCEIKIKDNQIMNWNDRSDYLPDILEKLDGLEYYLNDFVSTGIAYLDLCDKYNVNVFENNYPCIMFNNELLVTQGLEENVHTDMPEETQTDYTKSDKTDRRINQAYIIVDKQQQEITSLTKQTNSIQDNLTNNYYTIEQSNTLIQNAQSGLTNTFSEAGGNNIFRNTGLWFSQSDTDNPYEYWTGKNVSRQNTDKSSNGSLMMLKKGTLEQEQVVSNGNYTVSFKYKKLIQLATCKVIVNDNEYELIQMSDTEWQTGSKDANGNIVIKPLEVTSNHINVKFTSTVDNAIEIYDLMVNAGTVKLAYSQNENEVITDTVNISKGITITSSANDTKFKANADGIRIVYKNNEKTILTEFTDKGMSTKEMEVENGATIVKVLVQNVGSQTWFTRI